MSNKCIVFSLPDGSVRVVHPAYNDPVTGLKIGESEDDYISRVISRNIATGVIPPSTVYKILPEADLPSRTYRDSWRFNGVSVAHDMSVARQTKIDQEIRPERNKRLQNLDSEWSRAMAQGNVVVADRVEQKRQILRDIPQTVSESLNSIQTVSELKNYIPSWP